MTINAATTLGTATRAPEVPRRVHRHNATRRKESVGAWTLMLPYLVLLMIGGIIPIAYALYISVQQSPTLLEPNKTGFGGLQAYVTAISDFRFGQTFIDIFSVLIIWMPVMIVAIVGLALLVHASPGRFGSIMRFIYYIPGALGGVANLMLWVYLLNPTQSPISGFLQGMGYSTIKQVIATHGNLPVILAAMLLLQGLGAWIVTVNGGLNSLPDDVLEAASLDGATAWQLAWRIKIPMIRQWIGYAALLNLAYGFQLFLEPYLLNQVAAGALPSEYAPTQLGYWFAFVGNNFPAAAAMSIIIVLITLAIGFVVVFRSGLFSTEDNR
ncbi:MAG TPA: sugar ABC transporter permease [Microbacteriaceae bacterium]